MRTKRLILSAVAAFALAWGVLVLVAWQSRPPGDTTSPPPSPGGLGREQIARHDRPEDCWIVVRGKVYDVTRYIPSHPASRQTITDQCGKDSTSAFETKNLGRAHSDHAWKLLDAYRIGEARD